MTRNELEQQIEFLLKENKGMQSLILKFKKFIEINLDPFKTGIADFQDERNKGILAVLNGLGKIYNQRSKFQKIELVNSNPELKVIKFPPMEERSDVKD